MAALCQALIGIRRPGMTLELYLVKLNFTDASMPEVNVVVGGVRACGRVHSKRGGYVLGVVLARRRRGGAYMHGMRICMA